MSQPHFTPQAPPCDCPVLPPCDSHCGPHRHIDWCPTELVERLAEVEAERDRLTALFDREDHEWFKERAELDARAEAAQARLAEVEAERDAWFVSHDTARYNSEYAQEMRERAETAEAERDEHRNERYRLMKLISVRELDWEATKARLAAVMAEDFEAHCDCGKSHVLTSEVHATARGEGDRPASTSQCRDCGAWSGHNGGCGLAAGEGDRPHPFHMNSYVGPEPHCWCDRFASDPIHSGGAP